MCPPPQLLKGKDRRLQLGGRVDSVLIVTLRVLRVDVLAQRLRVPRFLQMTLVHAAPTTTRHRGLQFLYDYFEEEDESGSGKDILLRPAKQTV